VIIRISYAAAPGPLLNYLLGPGDRAPHRDQHVVAGFRPVGWLPNDPAGLVRLLAQPLAALRLPGTSPLVWHGSARTAPEDRRLSDEEWAAFAADAIDRCGFARTRWIAVRHAPEHIHIVAVLATADGLRVRRWNSYDLAADACRAAEVTYGLRRITPRDGTAARAPAPAETNTGRWPWPPRLMLRDLVQATAVAAGDEGGFFARLAGTGALVRPYVEDGTVTGYSAALPGHTARDGSPVYFSGSTLAPDLRLPALRRRWENRLPAPDGAPALLAAAAEAMAPDVAWATADVICALATALGRDATVCAASYAFDGAAREPLRVLPDPTPAGGRLRELARLIVNGGPPRPTDPVLRALAAVTAAVAELRDRQGRPWQAGAARRAGAYLSAALGRTRAAPDRSRHPRWDLSEDHPLSAERTRRDRLRLAAIPATDAPQRGMPSPRVPGRSPSTHR
jgi:hypothetical protein